MSGQQSSILGNNSGFPQERKRRLLYSGRPQTIEQLSRPSRPEVIKTEHHHQKHGMTTLTRHSANNSRLTGKKPEVNAKVTAMSIFLNITVNKQSMI